MASAAQTNATANVTPMDPALLAKLTGGLGDSKKVAKIGSEIGQIYTHFLPDIFQNETGIGIEIEYLGCESGLMTDLVRKLDKNFAVADCSLRNWCPNFLIGTGTAFIMALMERMLGAAPDTIMEPETRALSHIELDLSALVMGRIADVLRSAVNAPGGFEPSIDPPFNGNGKTIFEDAISAQFGMMIRLKVMIGKVASEFALVIPQRTLLKTTVVAPKPSAQALKKQEEWMEMISEQVKRSQVTLEARIRLQSLTLKTISRLVEGDVIPFRDISQDDICVEVSANGANMYNCEFGRAGDKYTVRVKNNVSTDDEILRHLMS